MTNKLSIIYDGIIILLFLTFSILTSINSRDLKDNLMTIYLVFYGIIGVVYPILSKQIFESNVSFFKGFLKITLFLIITQLLGYITYCLKTGAFIKFNDTMGLVIFIGFTVYAILITVVSFLVGFLVTKYVMK